MLDDRIWEAVYQGLEKAQNNPGISAIVAEKSRGMWGKESITYKELPYKVPLVHMDETGRYVTTGNIKWNITARVLNIMLEDITPDLTLTASVADAIVTALEYFEESEKEATPRGRRFGNNQ